MRQSEYVKKVKESSDGELDAMLANEHKNLHGYRQKIALKQLDNPKAVTIAKKNVARILCEKQERETKMGKVS